MILIPRSVLTGLPALLPYSQQSAQLNDFSEMVGALAAAGECLTKNSKTVAARNGYKRFVEGSRIKASSSRMFSRYAARLASHAASLGGASLSGQ